MSGIGDVGDVEVLVLAARGRAGEGVPGHEVKLERKPQYRVRKASGETVLAEGWQVRSVCECGRGSRWLPDTGSGRHRAELSGLGHAWVRGSAAVRAEKARERAEDAAERLRLADAGLVSRDRWASRHGIAWAAGRCLMCSRIGMCVCPLSCRVCSGCRCTCECYVCGLEDERPGAVC